jgi:hypothetical protein
MHPVQTSQFVRVKCWARDIIFFAWDGQLDMGPGVKLSPVGIDANRPMTMFS